jgi:hypothetical protein
MRFTTPQWRPSAAKRRSPLRSAIDVSGFASIVFALLFPHMRLLLPVHSLVCTDSKGFVTNQTGEHS